MSRRPPRSFLKCRRGPGSARCRSTRRTRGLAPGIEAGLPTAKISLLVDSSATGGALSTVKVALDKGAVIALQVPGTAVRDTLEIPMKIALGADHAGFRLKEHLKEQLAIAGHEVLDVGTNSEASTDYPDYALKVAQDVSQGIADRGILVCATGVGMSIAANKIHGIRAGIAVNDTEVKLTRSHNDANVLAMGATFTTPEQADRYANIFLNTGFEGGRHARRIDKITAMENSK